MRHLFLQLTIILFCLSACTGGQTITPAFYVWKSKLTAQDADSAYLNTLEAKKIYVRMFDVDDKGNGVRKATVTARPDYYKQTGEGTYQILQSHYLKGMWVNKDYELKVEEVDTETLLEAANLLKKRLRKEGRQLFPSVGNLLWRYAILQTSRARMQVFQLLCKNRALINSIYL